MRHRFRYIFYGVLSVVTFFLCEATFRVYDAVTTPYNNMDVWVKHTSSEVREHPLLGYTYPPNQVLSGGTQADEFGLPNVPQALQRKKVDVVAIGDSYVQAANGVFFDNFNARSISYHSLALFGYGPGSYNILMREYGPKLNPKIYLYFIYLGNDPGDIRRFESWHASGKSWYEFNGGYFMPIERRGYVWGWRLFLGRAKRFARSVLNRVSSEKYKRLKTVLNKGDDADTVFPYVLEAHALAQHQEVPMLVLIVPRTAQDKPFLDPVAQKLIGLCPKSGVECFDLDDAFGDARGRGRFFAPDGHWNGTGIQAAWTYLWDRKLAAAIQVQSLTRKE